MTRIARLLLSVCITVVVVVGVQSGAATAIGGDPLLSMIGQRGVDDLRECLASHNTLDAYYLIDSSGSMAETDPGKQRADLLANSLRELGSIRDEVAVSYAVGFFSSRFTPSIPWTTVSAGSVDAEAQHLADAVRTQPVSGGTDWQAAIAGAQGELAAQNSVRQGCQVLIWLTDGGISVGNNSSASNGTALNALCGRALMPQGAAPPAGSNGAFNELRQAGIVVFGVMLRVDGVEDSQITYVPYMQPLVEGYGQVSGADVTCGENPVPERYADGVYIQASSADDLALVFLRLGALVGGGAASPFGPDGSFPVDPGISSFSIITSSADWSLEDPQGAEVTAANAAGAGFRLEQSGQALRILSPLLDPDDAGTWRWAAGTSDRDTLYYFSGLRMQLDRLEVFLAGADNELSGRVARDEGEWIPLDAYTYNLQLNVITSAGPEEVQASSIDFNEATGEFTFHYAAQDAYGVITLQAALTEVSSVPSGTPLADISAQQEAIITLPDNYPTVSPIPVRLSELEGAHGNARGIVTLLAPADGTSGRICFPAGLTPAVDSDSADRADSWVWTASIDQECVELAAGGSSQIELAVENSVSANSDVTAHLTVQYFSESGEKLDGTVPVSFSTIRLVDTTAFGVLALVLLAIGILFPLLLLRGFGWWFTRINRGPHLLRASIPVRVAADGELTTVEGERFTAVSWGMDQFAFVANHPESRRFPDPELGAFRARVPVNPFGNPWYQLEASSGSVLIGSVGYLPRRLASRSRGRILGLKGDLGYVWGLILPEAAVRLSKDEPVTGRLVVYVRNPTGETSLFDDRMTQLATDPEIGRQLTAAREAIRDSGRQAPARTRDATGADARSGGPVVGETESLRRSAGTEADGPPRRDHLTRAPSDPPRRNDEPDSPRPPGPSAGDSGSPPRRPSAAGDDGPPRRPR